MSNLQIAKEVFKLVKREYLTPHFIRLTLEGKNVKPYEICTIGANNKLFIPPQNVDKVHFPTLDPETNSFVHAEEQIRPFVRTYTHRGIDLEKNQMIIDFVNHGENGPASSWAINAEKGDEIGVAMKLIKSELYPEADWYFLIGDATAIPVISAILESLPKQASGIAILETPTKEDEQILEKPDNFNVIWLHNPHPENGSELAQQAKMISIPNTCTKFGYVAAEFSTVKELRSYFRKELEWTKEELYAFSYWKSGVAEDKSVTDRHHEKDSVE